MICKGKKVIFELASGEDIKPPAAYGLLHDPHGREWSSRSLLVGPFTQGGTADADDVPDDAREYLGKSHRIKRGSTTLPPRRGPWEKLGEVAVLYYWRGGTRAPGGMRHPFGKVSIATLVKGKGRAHLSRCGRWYRLNLPPGALIDSRGLVWP